MQKQEDSEVGIGVLFAERYLIQRSLGSGGMGGVYLATDQLLDGSEVALKILHKELAADQKQLQRFFREVQVTRQITHRNIVRTFDVGQSVGRVFFTMEYVSGIVLKDILLEYGQLDYMQAVPILLDIANGLEAIHGQGVIHRDLKPANIILSQEGVARITDFGVARPKTSDLTHHSEVVGSTAYLSPEAWTGRDINFRTDLYALGVVAFEMLCGERPFEAGSPAEFMFKHLEQEPPSLRSFAADLPAWLDHLVLGLLAKDQYARPDSAVAVADALLEGLGGIDRMPAIPAEFQEEAPSVVAGPTGIRSVDEKAKQQRIKALEASLRSTISSQDVGDELLAEAAVEQHSQIGNLPDPLALPTAEKTVEYTVAEHEAVAPDSASDGLSAALTADRTASSSLSVVPFLLLALVATVSLPIGLHYMLAIGWDLIAALTGKTGWVSQFLASVLLVVSIGTSFSLPFILLRLIIVRQAERIVSWSLSLGGLLARISLVTFGMLSAYKVHVITSGGREETFMMALGVLSLPVTEAASQLLLNAVSFSLSGPGIAMLENDGTLKIVETTAPTAVYVMGVTLVAGWFAAAFSSRCFKIGTYGQIVPIALAGCLLGVDYALAIVYPMPAETWSVTVPYGPINLTCTSYQLLLLLPKWIFFLLVLKRFAAMLNTEKTGCRVTD